MQSELMKTKYSNESGFTLIEVLVAGVVTVMGLLTMASFTGNVVTQNASNERKIIAMVMAEEKIDGLRSDAMTTDLTDADNNTETVTTEAGTFTRSWIIAEDFAGSADQIEVMVDWDGPGDSRITLATLIDN